MIRFIGGMVMLAVTSLYLFLLNLGLMALLTLPIRSNDKRWQESVRDVCDSVECLRLAYTAKLIEMAAVARSFQEPTPIEAGSL